MMMTRGICAICLLAVCMAATGAVPETLTREGAEKKALANNPRIRISELLSKIQGQVVRETRAGELPSLSANLTGVEADEGSRIGAGSLTASRLLTHAGAGLQFNQLITDFGRTRNLVASEKLREKARQADAGASQNEIILATDQVFYQALEAQETLKIADQAVATRQSLVDRVGALAGAKLKSTLDLSFAQVDLARAKLLQLDARNNIDSAKAALTAVLGIDQSAAPPNYTLVADTGDLPVLPANALSLIDTALHDRPDLQSLELAEQSAQKFSQAQREQFLPTVTAIATIGATPFGSSQYFTSNWYGAAGFNVSVPVFEGFHIHAQASEAALEVHAADEKRREQRIKIARDVETAWLNANTERQRVNVAADLMQQAAMALDLAQTRYSLGLSSIVELSQAQLQNTEAEIGNANAQTQYRLAIATLRFQVGGMP